MNQPRPEKMSKSLKRNTDRYYFNEVRFARSRFSSFSFYRYFRIENSNTTLFRIETERETSAQ